MKKEEKITPFNQWWKEHMEPYIKEVKKAYRQRERNYLKSKNGNNRKTRQKRAV